MNKFEVLVTAVGGTAIVAVLTFVVFLVTFVALDVHRAKADVLTWRYIIFEEPDILVRRYNFSAAPKAMAKFVFRCTVYMALLVTLYFGFQSILTSV